jgi:hypothetical protein
MMEAVRTSETSVDNHFTRQYNPEDSSEQPLNEIVDFYKSLQGGFAIEGDLNAITINILASSILKWRTFNFRGGCKSLHQPRSSFAVMVTR